MSKFKQTEIGEIPMGWELRELGSLGQVITGKTPPTINADNFGDGYPFITPRDMIGEKYVRSTERYVTEKGKGFVKNCFLPAESVCVSCIGSDMGKVIMTDRPSITNQQLNSLVCDQAEPQFVYYGVINIADELRNEAFHSTAVPILNKSAFSRFEILIPKEKSEQRAIAKSLSDLDDKIELNHQMNKTLEAMGQTLFKRWFVDFEFPGHKETEFVNGLPEGWCISKIGEELITVLGGTPAREKSQYWDNGTIPWINSGKANEFRVIEPSELITKEGLDNSATKIMPEKTTIIAITGATLGQVSLLEISACANQSIVGVLPSDRMPAQFIYFWIKNNIDRLISWQTGGAQQHINKNNVNDLELFCPSEEVMQEYVAISKPLFEQIRLNCFESKTLTLVRDSFLPKLMLGKIRVK